MLGIVPWFSEEEASRELPGALQVTLQEPVSALPEDRPPAQLTADPARPAAQPSRPKAPTRLVLEPAEPIADERRSFAVGADFAEPSASLAAGAGSRETVAVAPPSVDAAYLNSPPPSYPQAARRAGEQGTVMLRVLVSREGSAARVELEKSSGSTHLDAAARETVKAWRFTPARRGGEAVESWMVVPVVFRLEGPS